MLKKISLVFIIFSLSFWNLLAIKDKNYIDTTIESFPKYSLYINDDISIKFDSNIEIEKNKKTSYIYNDLSIDIPRLSWLVKDISDKLWKENFIELRKKWIIDVRWDLLKFWKIQAYWWVYWASEEYFKWNSDDLLSIEWNFIENKISYTIDSKNDNNKIIIDPFDKKQLGTRFTSWIEWPIPKITIYDDIKLPIDLLIKIKDNWWEVYKPEIKYNIYKYLVNIPNNTWERLTTNSYIIAPYYEFDLPKINWKKELEVFYKIYKWNNNSFQIIEYNLD